MASPDPRSLDRRRREPAAPAVPPQPRDAIPYGVVEAFIETLGCDPAQVQHLTVNRDGVHVVEYAIGPDGRRRWSGGEPITTRRRVLIDRARGVADD